ncbi:hypothetical protein ScPMuIL_008488 [Solemya velum]
MSRNKPHKVPLFRYSLKQQAMSQSEDFEHYCPQHPLPEELQKMERDDTVCKYCGVSYLIHNEIKALEAKLKLTEQELERYRGSDERELKLKEELQQLIEERAELLMNATTKDALISSLKNKLSNEEDGHERLTTQKRTLEDKLKTEVRNAEMFRLRHSTLEQHLPRVMVTLKEQRQALQQIHEFIAHRDQQLTNEISLVLASIRNICSQQEIETSKMRSHISHLEKENSETREKVRYHEAGVSKMQKFQTENKTLLDKCGDLENRVAEMKSSLHQAESKTRNLALEAQQFRDQLKNKTSEVEEITSQMKKRDKGLQVTVQKLEDELKKKDADLNNLKKQMKNLEMKYEDEVMKKEEVHRRATLTVNETEELKECLKKSQEDLEALKNERELMVSAHQNRIEQLRESFKQKLYEADQFPQKLEEAMKKERHKHAQELSSLEETLRENFILELQIEKQKYQELLMKYQSGNKDEEAKLKAQLTQMESRYRCEMKDLQKILTDTKNRATEMEESLRREIESLKSIIKNLENRLARLDAGNEDVMVALRQQLQETHSELEQTRDTATQLDNKLAQNKEEIHFLQETVKRECEERFELTEALSEAREKLLHLKKPAGGYASSRPNTNSSSISKVSENSHGSITSAGSNGSASNRIPPLTSGQHRAEPFLDRDLATTNNNTMTFQGQGAKDTGKLKGNSLSEHRRRIAAILGRKT